MSEPTQRAECDLSDGSHLEIAWTPGSRSVGSTKAPALDLERLVALVRGHAEALRLPKPSLASATRGLVGKSPSIQAMLRMIEKVAPTQATVLIMGENGTGKELVARAIHAGSARSDRPFVAANVSAFNDNLLESELFGHKRGAFTGAVADKRGLFEEADTGTFLLDEVGDMSAALQSKLLRVLQEGTFMPVG
ncbi:MAG TPA: sigma-54 factor interaction domain-containing protein, partial [Polyangiales bacterium]